MTSLSRLKNRSGQMTIEAVLIMTLLFSLVFMARQTFQEQQILSNMVAGPWSYMTGMIESGIWQPDTQARSLHPNRLSRHGSPEGTPL